MTEKLSRRRFLLSVSAALFGGWLQRYWKEPELLPAPPGCISYDGELKEEFWRGYLDQWHCYSEHWKPGEPTRRYVDGVLQKEPIAWWPIKLEGIDA